MRNATSIVLFGASALGLTLLGAACGGGGDDGTRPDGTSGSTNTSGSGTTVAGTTSTSGNTSTGGSATGGSGTGGASAGAGTCNPVPGLKHGDGTDTSIDEIDDTNTMFTPAGMGAGSWDFSKDTSMGTITPTGTTTLAPVTGGHMGSALHVQGMALSGWGAALAAFLNGPTGAFDASMYGGVAFWIKGTSTVQEGANKVMVQARMPDVLPGPGSCCDDKILGMECYSGHRVVIDVPADWTEVKIAWSDFKGPTFGLGSTIMLNPNRIRDVDFSFNHDAASAATSSSFDFWVDGMRFLKKDEMGNIVPGGGGGSAATGGGGSGGAATGGGGSGGAATGGGGTGGTGGTQ
jgi:hypothetical protein